MWGRKYLLFWKKSCFSFRLPTSRLFCGFRQIFFGSVVKNGFYVSKENFWGKTLFSGENVCFFFNIFGLWSIFCHYSNFLAVTSKLPSKSRNAFPGKFLKMFFVTLGHGAKKFGLFSKIFRQGCQTSFYVSTEIFEKQSNFREKVGFFLSSSSILSIFFDDLVITACYVSKYNSRLNEIFRKRNFYHFRTMSANFPGVRKKISAGSHKGNLTVRKDDFRRKFVIKKPSFPSLSYLEEKIFCPLQNKFAKCHKCNLRVHGNSLMKYFVWKNLVFLSFLDIQR